MQENYRKMFSEVRASDSLKQEVQKMTQSTDRTQRPRRKMPRIAAAAAALVIVMAGTAIAMVAMPGTLDGWFGREWSQLTEIDMNEAQALAIESLTQKVGVSDEAKGVTVTLDSITVGDSAMWLMLKVQGDIPEAAPDRSCSFRRIDLTFENDPDSEDTPGGYSFSTEGGMTEDGCLTIFLRYDITLTGDDTLAAGTAELRLSDLMLSDTEYLRGEWIIPFEFEAAEQECLTLDSAIVPARDHSTDGADSTTVELRDIRVTSTGVRFCQSPEASALYPELRSVVLEDGTEIPSGDGGSRWSGQLYTGDWVSSYVWRLPVDISQVAGIRFGDEIFPLE